MRRIPTEQKNILSLSHTLQALAIFNQIAQAVEAVHAAGTVHRDIKPDNVFMCGKTNKVCKLGDFGVSKILEEFEYVPCICIFDTRFKGHLSKCTESTPFSNIRLSCSYLTVYLCFKYENRIVKLFNLELTVNWTAVQQFWAPFVQGHSGICLVFLKTPLVSFWLKLGTQIIQNISSCY